MAECGVLLDITRLMRRAARVTPTGIDRIELAYANFFAADPRTRFLVQHGARNRVLDRGAALDLLRMLNDRWSAREDDADTRVANLVEQALQSSATRSIRLSGSGRWRAKPRAYAADVSVYLRFARAWLADSSSRQLGCTPDCAYLYVGQQLLSPDAFAWVGRQRVDAVFYLHDLIPIAYPEYFTPARAESHKVRLETVRAHARAIIVNSAATRHDLQRYWSIGDADPPRMYTIAPAVDAAFLALRRQRRRHASVPYFVAVGTLAPHKNPDLLIDLWRGIVAELGTDAPRLVWVGARSGDARIARHLDSPHTLPSHFVEIGGLGDRALASLLAGALALLMPSFAEGYGMPVAEALAAGVPVVASDIPAHREVGGDFAQYVDPRDARAWRAHVLRMAAPGSEYRMQLCGKIEAYRPPTWDEHFAKVQTMLREIGTGSPADG